MDKELLYKYVAAKTTPQEEEAVLKYIREGHEEELLDVQRRFELGAMCAPTVNELHEQDRRGKAKDSGFLRNFTRIITSAAAVIAVGLFAWNSFKPQEEAAEQVQPMSFSTVMGKSRIVLPDGTVAWLHNNACLSYNSDFGEESRSIALSGEAFFQVAKDSLCPFVIDVDGFEIEVLGTSFNVKPSEACVDVSLVEGKVKLSAENLEPMEMTAGYAAHYDKRAQFIDVNRCDTEIAALWAQEWISFQSQPLEEICRKLEVWYDRKIYIDKAVAKHRFTFTITTEPVDAVLSYIKRIHPDISYSVAQDGSITIY